MDNPSIPLKRCTRCGQEFPATIEYFYRDTSRKNGLNYRCRICARTVQRKPPHFPPTPEGQKRCSKCHDCFPADHHYFHADKHRPDGLTIYCRSCVLKHKVKPRTIYPPILPGFKRCGRCKAIKPALDVYFHRNQSKPDGLDSLCMTCAAKIKKHLTPKARSKNVIYAHIRRAMEINLPHDLTESEWEQCKIYFNFRCAACNRKVKTLEQDHWIPITASGFYNPGYSILNIVPLCRSCNSSKHNRNATEWLEWKFGVVEAKQILTHIEAYFDWIRQQGGSG